MDVDGKVIEVQVRTELQHAWAELSEKLSDEIDSAIKYGGGSVALVSHLETMSDATMDIESAIKSKDINRMLVEIKRWPDFIAQLREILDLEKGQKNALSN